MEVAQNKKGELHYDKYFDIRRRPLMSVESALSLMISFAGLITYIIFGVTNTNGKK